MSLSPLIEVVNERRRTIMEMEYHMHVLHTVLDDLEHLEVE